MNKKGYFSLAPIMGMVILLMIGIIVVPVMIQGTKQQKIIDSLDKNCYRTEKEMYCKSIGMELGSIVVTPGGLFGGSAYNKEACVNEHSEKIINFKDINYERCITM